MKKVRWGVLSTANIGLKKVIPAMQQAASCDVVAIASRCFESAQAAAAPLGIQRAYGSYEELLADDDIDAVYNPLPNHLHVPWSIKALEAGKHVLCEKPIGLTAAEGQQLVNAGKQHPHLKLMEAFMYRHHPQWQFAKRAVVQGRIGDLQTIQSVFSYFNDDADNIRNQADIGGGALMDIGCYNISLSRFLCDAEPLRVVGTIETDPKFATDKKATAILQFDHGVTSSFVCSTQMVPYQRVNIFGTNGRIEIEIPFNAPPEAACKTWLQTEEGIELVEHQVSDQYAIQGELMSQAILNNTPVPTPIQDAVANMRVIEAVKASVSSGGWIAL